MGVGQGSAVRGFPAAPLLSPDNPGELVVGNAHIRPVRTPRGTVLARPQVDDAATTGLHNGLPFGATGAPVPGPPADTSAYTRGPSEDTPVDDPLQPQAAPLQAPSTLPPAAPEGALPPGPVGLAPAPPPRVELGVSAVPFDTPATPQAATPFEPAAPPMVSTPFEPAAPPMVAPPFEPAPVAAAVPFEAPPPARVDLLPAHAARPPRMTVPHTSGAPADPVALVFAAGPPTASPLPAPPALAPAAEASEPSPVDASPWARERNMLPAVSEPPAYIPPAYTPPPAQAAPVARLAPQRSSGGGTWIGVVAVVILLAAAGAGAYFWSRSRPMGERPVSAPTGDAQHPRTGDASGNEGPGEAHPTQGGPATARPIEIPMPTYVPRGSGHAAPPTSAAPPSEPAPGDNKRFEPEGI